MQSSATLLAHEVSLVPISPLVLVTLFVILGASVWIFATLVKRETRHRRVLALVQWARSRNLRPAGGDADLPILAPLKPFKPKIQSIFRGENLALVQFETAETALDSAVVAARQWNLLFRDLIPTGAPPPSVPPRTPSAPSTCFPSPAIPH